MFVLYYSTNTTQQLVAALFNQPNYYILCAEYKYYAVF